MARPFRKFKNVIKYGTIHRLLDLARLIPPDKVGKSADVLGSVLYSTIPLRRKVRKNMELALGRDNVPADAPRDYFWKLGMWASYAAQSYHRGYDNSGVPDWMVFDDSIAVLEDALSRGRGVIYSVPHLIAHEVTAGVMAQQYPTVGLVRESKYEPHMRVKERYYTTTGGCDVIFRPRRGNVASDMRVCTRSLKQGKILAITPDLLTGPGEGVSIEFLGRTINLRPGIITLSMVTGAPVVNAFLRWEKDRVFIHCDEPKEYTRSGDREQTMIKGMQDWGDTFAQYLIQHPSSWTFWLDRHWSNVWRTSENKRAES